MTLTEPLAAGADARAVSVRVDVPPAPIVDGLSVAVTPGSVLPVKGSMAVATRFVVPVNPPVACALMVVEAVDPGARVRKDVFARIMMPGGAVTERLSGVVALRLPLTPVIVSAVVTGAPLLEVSCSEAVPPALTVAGVKTACTMQGRPVTAKVTLPVKAPAAATVTVLEADDPHGRLIDGEAALRVNPEATFAVTVKLTRAVAPRLPLAPVTVRLAVVAAAEAAAVSVSTAVPPGATAAGVNAAVTPAGRPETDSATLPVKPPVPAKPMLAVAEDPAASATVEGVALRVNPAAAACTTEKVSPAMVRVPVREALVAFAATE
jgi:hypothetical protein